MLRYILLYMHNYVIFTDLDNQAGVKEKSRHVLQFQSIRRTYDKKKPYGCLICELRCPTNGDLKQHVNTVHEGKKPHDCSTCDKKFATKGSLNQHINRAHN